MGLSGRVVVVTGASAGVGRATALAFAKAGAHVGLLARGRDRLEGARLEVEAAGAQAMAVVTDVSDAEAVEAAAAAVEEQLGPVAVWVNNAMTSVFSPVRQLEPAEVCRVMEVTYLGTVHGTLAALRRMLPRDEGTIVQVGSALAYRAIPLQAAYSAAKFATRGFTDSLRCELRHDASRVRLTTVHLPGLNTPQFEWVKTRLVGRPRPMPPVYQPEVAARAIVWAAEHPGRERFVGPSTLATVWANKVAPGLVDRYLARTGFEAQQADEPVDADRPDNLWEPAPGRHGARGRFDAMAKPRSLQLEASIQRRRLAAVAAAGLGAGAVVAGRRR